MKQTPHDALESLLNRWNKTPEAPPHLSTEVWRRIAVAESAEENASLWSRIEAVFARPSFAFAFISACMLCGLFFAEVRLSKLHAERSAQLAKSYLRLIDPLLSDLSTPKGTSAVHKS
ncbi:MAG: hypothetical protein WC378_16960 [Opitutaceae bacterium]|jgi:hypothetical protein